MGHPPDHPKSDSDELAADDGIRIAGGIDEASARRGELTLRAAGLPGALAASWLAVRTAPGLVRLVTMWVHESGHAVSAWLCGYFAVPGPWFTPVAAERSIVVPILLGGLLGTGGFLAWRSSRTLWAAAAAATLLIALVCTAVLTTIQAQQFIVFGGDGGAMILGTMLMLTIFAPKGSALERNHVRWGLLVIGALALMDAHAVWSGPVSRLPFGENENGLSDPSVLVEQFGWTVADLVRRYLQVADACFFALGISYVLGVIIPAIEEFS
jgi:hypothetical protein